jgi:hypothetical protein
MITLALMLMLIYKRPPKPGTLRWMREQAWAKARRADAELIRLDAMQRWGMDPNLSIKANLYHDAWLDETGRAWIEADPPQWVWPTWENHAHGTTTPR